MYNPVVGVLCTACVQYYKHGVVSRAHAKYKVWYRLPVMFDIFPKIWSNRTTATRFPAKRALNCGQSNELVLNARDIRDICTAVHFL